MVIVIMGVAGVGKTTIGKLLSEDLGWPFYEGDDFHTPANVEKMSRGTPLSDEDRWPWLAEIRNLIDRLIAQGQDAVLACSALKRSYRDRLQTDAAQVAFVYLKGDYGTVWERLLARPGHFMRAGMLESQFQTLEEPDDAMTVEISQEPGAIVGAIKSGLWSE